MLVPYREIWNEQNIKVCGENFFLFLFITATFASDLLASEYMCQYHIDSAIKHAEKALGFKNANKDIEAKLHGSMFQSDLISARVECKGIPEADELLQEYDRLERKMVGFGWISTSKKYKKMQTRAPVQTNSKPATKQKSITEIVWERKEHKILMAEKYKNSPSVDIDGNIILGIKSFSYFRGDKSKILIESASGKFFFPAEKVRSAKFSNMTDALNKSIDTLLK